MEKNKNTLNVSHERNRKTLMRYLFYVDLAIIISSFFIEVNFKVAFLINIFILALQNLMDFVQPRVQGVLNKGGWAAKVNNIAGRR